MAVLNPDHLLEQAAHLVEPPPHGPPRQVDLRRAVSSSYYGLFHTLAAAAADDMIGAAHQASGRYCLVYRSIDHKTIAALCADVQKSSLPAKYGPYVDADLFQAGFKRFAGIARELQQRRHKADYDPGSRFKTADALIAIRLAREAITLFQASSEAEKRAFLTLLVCQPR